MSTRRHIGRSESFANLLRVQPLSLVDILLRGEQGDQLVTVERGELDSVSEHVVNELAATVEPSPLPRRVDPFEERPRRFEIHRDDVVLTISVCTCFRYA